MCLTALIPVWRASFTFLLLSKEPYCLDIVHLGPDLEAEEASEAQKQIDDHGGVKLEMK